MAQAHNVSADLKKNQRHLVCGRTKDIVLSETLLIKLFEAFLSSEDVPRLGVRNQGVSG